MSFDKFAHFLYQPCAPLGPDGRLATGSPAHIALSLEAACEGMVLLKNDNNVLPLAKGTKVALFGTAQFDYVRGGGGSGDVTTAYTRNIYEGFKMKEEEGLVEVFEPVSELFRNSVREQKEKNGQGSRCEQPEIPASLLASAKEFTDTAVFSICRYSWEGGDRKGVVGDGDYYLSKSEEELKNTLAANFKNVIVVLDVGGVVDSQWFKYDDRFAGVLLAWQAGIEGGLAIANTVCGLSNPSGRLVDTFPDSFDAFPSSEHFNDSKEYVDYTEDVYVGYRYFETFPEMKAHVNYPFGYGLSYTGFKTEIENVKIGTCKSEGIASINKSDVDFGAVTVSVKITNTGKVAGKEAAGLYYCAPAGKLFKPAKQLAAFAKTGLLAPGQSETVELKLAFADMASFDDLGKVEKSAYILEAGKYSFFVGTDVTKLIEAERAFELGDTKVVCRLSSKCAPNKLAKRLLGDGSYEELKCDDSPVNTRTTCYDGWKVPERRTIIGEVEHCVYPLATETGIDPEGIKSKVSPNFMDVVRGRQSLDDFVAMMPVEAIIEMLGGQPNTGVSNTFGMGNFPEYNIPNITTADGPAGLRIDAGRGVTTTAWPIATMLACTWNTELVEKVGAAGGLEVKENHIGLWLTPAMNIHRSPLCGRNFEYYSEDPVITGKMGAAMIRGIQSQGVGTSMKHFACNNKEENRFCCDSRVSERALREIYLKGFEIAVKEADPWTIMSSYNLVNGTYSSRNHDLLTGILRGEWGYEGMVTTDWMNWSGQDHEVIAGNDLKMPKGEPEVLYESYKAGKVTRAQLELCIKRILKTILKFD